MSCGSRWHIPLRSWNPGDQNTWKPQIEPELINWRHDILLPITSTNLQRSLWQNVKVILTCFWHCSISYYLQIFIYLFYFWFNKQNVHIFKYFFSILSTNVVFFIFFLGMGRWNFFSTVSSFDFTEWEYMKKLSIIEIIEYMYPYCVFILSENVWVYGYRKMPNVYCVVHTINECVFGFMYRGKR